MAVGFQTWKSTVFELSCIRKKLPEEIRQVCRRSRNNCLHVNRLSLEKGEIDIEGRTDSLVYSAGGGAKSGESFFAKLFK